MAGHFGRRQHPHEAKAASAAGQLCAREQQVLKARDHAGLPGCSTTQVGSMHLH